MKVAEAKLALHVLYTQITQNKDDELRSKNEPENGDLIECVDQTLALLHPFSEEDTLSSELEENIKKIEMQIRELLPSIKQMKREDGQYLRLAKTASWSSSHNSQEGNVIICGGDEESCSLTPTKVASWNITNESNDEDKESPVLTRTKIAFCVTSKISKNYEKGPFCGYEDAINSTPVKSESRKPHNTKLYSYHVSGYTELNPEKKLIIGLHNRSKRLSLKRNRQFIRESFNDSKSLSAKLDRMIYVTRFVYKRIKIFRHI